MTIRTHAFARLARLLAVVTLVAGATIAPLPGIGSADEASTPGLRLLGYVSDDLEHLTDSDGHLLVDPVHRRALVFHRRGGPLRLQWSVYDLDHRESDGRFKELAPIVVGAYTIPPPDFEVDPDMLPTSTTLPNGVKNQLNNAANQANGVINAVNNNSTGDESRTAANQFGWDMASTIDPTAGRIFYTAHDALYEISQYDPTLAEGNYKLSKWVAPTEWTFDVDDVHAQPPTLSNSLVPRAVTFDDGSDLPGPRVYVLYEQQPPVRGASVPWIAAWDARPGSGDPTVAEVRQKWIRPLRTCAGLVYGSSRPVLLRREDWLYVGCDASQDRSAVGAARVHLAKDALGEPTPDGTEEFTPGVPGAGALLSSGDAGGGRLYFANTTPGKGWNTLVFDAQVGATGGYIGEIALTRDEGDRVTMGLDATVGRWYFHTTAGVHVQDGRLKRLAQATVYRTDTENRPLGWEKASELPGYRLPVLPTVLGADGKVERPALVFLWRHKNQGRCPDTGTSCYAVYEDRTPLPAEPLPPTERTIGEPESADSIGVYSTVASAYGMRVRMLRGFSGTWPNGIPFTGTTGSLEGSKDSPPDDPLDYATDPFFYHGGDCGSKDRELAFARVLETQLAGGLDAPEASARALAVDPDVHRPSAPDDRRTRDDVRRPDACTVGLLRTLGTPVCDLFPFPIDDENFSQAQEGWDQFRGEWKENCDPGAQQFYGGASQAIGAFGREWPYALAECKGSGKPRGQTAASPAFGEASVACAAGAPDPSVTTATRSVLSPDPAKSPVTVQDAQAWTRILRQGWTPTRAANGVVVESHALVRGVSILGGFVKLDTIELIARAQTLGFPGDKSATGTLQRKFSGLEVAGQVVCAGPCSEPQVLAEINRALGARGSVRVRQPEADVKLGTTKGTLAVVQKQLLQQDADAIMNGDYTSEVPGLEITIFRDGVERGRGRWIVQLGGVFVQAQIGVIDALGDLGPDGFLEDLDDLGDLDLGPVLSGRDAVAARGPVTYAVAIDPVSVAQPAGRDDDRVQSAIEQITQALQKGVGAALLLGALWTLVYGPAYLARRRQLLRQVTGP